MTGQSDKKRQEEMKPGRKIEAAGWTSGDKGEE